MILTKFTHLKIVHTAGKNLSIADMLSRDFSSLTNSQCQIEHKNLPPQIEFTQLSSTNSLTPVHYLVKHEEIFPTQNNYSHLILVDFGDDYYSLRIHDSGNRNKRGLGRRYQRCCVWVVRQAHDLLSRRVDCLFRLLWCI